MVTWRIYYGDGTTFDSSMGTPQQAPGLDVQVIVQPDERVGRVLLTRFDWYYFRTDLGEWWASDYFGLLDQLTSDRDGVVVAVKAGRNARAYDEILQRALHDPDFPTKSARLAGERG